MRAQQAKEALDERLGVDSAGARLERRQIGCQHCGVVLHQGVSERLLDGEELVERADRRAGARGDLGHRRRFVSFLGKYGGGRLQKRRYALLAARALGQTGAVDLSVA